MPLPLKNAPGTTDTGRQKLPAIKLNQKEPGLAVWHGAGLFFRVKFETLLRVLCAGYRLPVFAVQRTGARKRVGEE